MTVDIEFGIIEKYEEDGEIYQNCIWPGKEYDKELNYQGKEDDGTSPEWTILSGCPRRSFSTHGFYDWIERIPEANVLIKACERPNSNDFSIAYLDETIMHLINLLPETGESYDVDRAKWFKYWSRRAREEFGDKAIIAFW